MSAGAGILAGKAVVITGSGKGIGAAYAKACARRGAFVVVNDIAAAAANDTLAAIRAAGGQAISCVADISDWEEAGRLVEACLTAFGKIDGLVNNAALLHHARIDQFDPVSARALVDVNVLGTLYCAAHAVKPMLAQKSGSIVNVISGAHMGMLNLGVYGATKGAVASMVYTWAIELEGSGVRVNAISPSAATTMGQAKGKPIPEEHLKAMALLPRPESNTPVVEYLLSDLSAHINGQLIRIFNKDLYLCTHPALLLPRATNENWTAESVAKTFDHDFKDRQIPCGFYGTTELPVDLKPRN